MWRDTWFSDVLRGHLRRGCEDSSVRPRSSGCRGYAQCAPGSWARKKEQTLPPYRSLRQEAWRREPLTGKQWSSAEPVWGTEQSLASCRKRLREAGTRIVCLRMSPRSRTGSHRQHLKLSLTLRQRWVTGWARLLGARKGGVAQGQVLKQPLTPSPCRLSHLEVSCEDGSHSTGSSGPLWLAPPNRPRASKSRC